MNYNQPFTSAVEYSQEEKGLKPIDERVELFKKKCMLFDTNYTGVYIRFKQDVSKAIDYVEPSNNLLSMSMYINDGAWYNDASRVKSVYTNNDESQNVNAKKPYIKENNFPVLLPPLKCNFIGGGDAFVLYTFSSLGVLTPVSDFHSVGEFAGNPKRDDEMTGDIAIHFMRDSKAIIPVVFYEKNDTSHSSMVHQSIYSVLYEIVGEFQSIQEWEMGYNYTLNQLLPSIEQWENR